MMKETNIRWLIIFIVVMLFIIPVSAQERGRWQPPPPQPVDTAALRARQDSIQAFLDKLNSAIEGKQDSPATSVFQNVQLFKTATAERMLGQMRNWTRALGVNCTYCHVAGEWQKDDIKPKLAAREMDKLEDDVNALLKNVKSIDSDAHINCSTCHRGSPKPGGEFRGGPGRGRREGR